MDPPKHHVHLIVVARLADCRKPNILELKQKYSHATRLFKMTLDEEAIKLGLEDLFEGMEEAEASTSTKPPVLVLKEKEKASLEKVVKEPIKPFGEAATDEFPRSTTIIIPIEELFKYSLEVGTEMTVPPKAVPSKRK